MIPFFRLFPLCLATVLLWIAPPVYLAAADNTKRPRTFRVMSMVSTYDDMFYQVNSQERIDVRLGSAPSSPLPVPSGSRLRFLREIPPPPDAPPNTPPTRQTLFDAPIPDTNEDFYVIARPLVPEDKKTVFEATVVPFPEDFTAGKCLIANLSPFSEAAISIKDRVHKVSKGQKQFIQLDVGHSPIKVAVFVGPAWGLAAEDAWRLWPNQRGLILIFPYIKDPDYPPLVNPPPAVAYIAFEHMRAKQLGSR